MYHTRDRHQQLDEWTYQRMNERMYMDGISSQSPVRPVPVWTGNGGGAPSRRLRRKCGAESSSSSFNSDDATINRDTTCCILPPGMHRSYLRTQKNIANKNKQLRTTQLHKQTNEERGRGKKKQTHQSVADPFPSFSSLSLFAKSFLVHHLFTLPRFLLPPSSSYSSFGLIVRGCGVAGVLVTKLAAEGMAGLNPLRVLEFLFYFLLLWGIAIFLSIFCFIIFLSVLGLWCLKLVW